jgi:hypothetical protein
MKVRNQTRITADIFETNGKIFLTAPNSNEVVSKKLKIRTYTGQRFEIKPVAFSFSKECKERKLQH